jgi:hypothetical protein
MDKLDWEGGVQLVHLPCSARIYKSNLDYICTEQMLSLSLDRSDPVRRKLEPTMRHYVCRLSMWCTHHDKDGKDSKTNSI